MCNYIIGLKVAGKDELEQKKECFSFEDAMNVAHELCNKMMGNSRYIREWADPETNTVTMDYGSHTNFVKIYPIEEKVNITNQHTEYVARMISKKRLRVKIWFHG